MSNKKSILRIITIPIFCGMVIISCTHNTQVVTPTISFSKDIIPILSSSCALNSSCHSGANSTNLGINLDSAAAYHTLVAKELIKTNNPTASLLYVEVKTGVMPLTPYKELPVNQQQIILFWIEQGATEN